MAASITQLYAERAPLLTGFDIPPTCEKRVGPPEGNAANLCEHDHERLVDVLREHAAPKWVIRDGQILT